MIERAIENWLINTHERNFQIPFCQVLLSQGHKILYISPHTQMEQGKDIVSLGPDGKYHAYQLKTGKLDLGEWRSIKAEVMECVELEIIHPAVPQGSKHISYVVTNGEIKDTVRHQITQINQQNKKRFGPLKTITGTQLVGEFIEAQGKFLPTEVLDFDSFLKLYLADGRDFLSVQQFFDLIDRCYFQVVPKSKKDKLDVISSSVILTGYALRPFQQAENNYAEFQAWTALCGSIIRFAARADLKPKDFAGSLSLAKTEMIRSLERLSLEATQRADFLEGELVGDGGEMYKSRTTLVLGGVALLELFRLHSNLAYVLDERLKALVVDNIKSLGYWGDSAFPSLFAILKYLELIDQKLFEQTFIDLSNLVIQESASEKEGLANPYYSPQQVLSHSMGCGDDELEWTNFAGESYALETLVHFGATREMREFLSTNWKAISNIMYAQFSVDDETDWFTCYAAKGTTSTAWPPAQESWRRLKQVAVDKQSCPQIVTTNLEIAFAFLFVIPYRGTPDVYKSIDAAFGRQTLWEYR